MGDVRSVARVATKLPARYMTQLCKHFEHKLPVTYDATTGTITFSLGICALQAEDGVLVLSLTAGDPAALAQLQDVVARHLVRFAFREEMHIIWQS